MSDNDHGGLQLRLHLAQCLHDQSLYDHIKRTGRLVGNDHLGLKQDRHGNADALFHAAAQFVRMEFANGSRQPHQSQHLINVVVHAVGGPVPLVRSKNVTQLMLDFHHRVKRVHRPLRDQGQVTPAHSSHLCLVEVQQVRTAVVRDGAFDFGWRLEQAQQCQCQA